MRGHSNYGGVLIDSDIDSLVHDHAWHGGCDALVEATDLRMRGIHTVTHIIHITMHMHAASKHSIKRRQC